VGQDATDTEATVRFAAPLLGRSVDDGAAATAGVLVGGLPEVVVGAGGEVVVGAAGGAVVAAVACFGVPRLEEPVIADTASTREHGSCNDANRSHPSLPLPGPDRSRT
jgi:hypothetical protein